MLRCGVLAGRVPAPPASCGSSAGAAAAAAAPAAAALLPRPRSGLASCPALLGLQEAKGRGLREG